MQPMSSKMRTVYFYLFLLLFIACFPLIYLYANGYSITSGFELVKNGGIYMYIPRAGFNVYLNDELVDTSGTFQKEFIFRGLKPAEYTVVVERDGYWPWAKKVNVREGKVVPLYPFSVPKETKLREVPRFIETDSGIPRINHEYEQVALLFLPPATSTIKERKDLNNADPLGDESRVKGRISLLRRGNQIYAYWSGNVNAAPDAFCLGGSCVAEILVFESGSEVRYFDFYPRRNDVIIVSNERGIYAVEMHKGQFQNFQPIYKDSALDFRIREGEYVYAKTGDYLVEIEL